MQKATVVKKPKTFWARTRVECIVCGFEGWECCGGSGGETLRPQPCEASSRLLGMNVM